MAEESKKHWHMLRVNRDKLLAATDKTQLGDFPIDTATRGLYRKYRDYLRNLPKWYNDDTIAAAKVMSFVEWREWYRL